MTKGKAVVGFLNGPQGVGKGFTFDELGRRYPDIQRIGMSSLFKAHREAQGLHAQVLAHHMDVLKDLVPSSITVDILEQDLARRFDGRGEEVLYIAIEGFPRNLEQALQTVGSLVRSPDVVLVQFVLQAASGVADQNAAVRNRGPDDSPEGRAKRQKIYQTETLPAINAVRCQLGVPTFFYEGGLGEMYIENAQRIAAVMYGLGGET